MPLANGISINILGQRGAQLFGARAAEFPMDKLLEPQVIRLGGSTARHTSELS